MRDLEGGGKSFCQPVGRNADAVVDSGALCFDPLSFDAVQMQHRGMGSQARPYRRSGIVPGPIDNIGEFAPERLLGEGCRIWLRAGGDQPVDLKPCDFSNVGVLTLEAPLLRLRASHGWQREAVKIDANVAGRSS